MASCANCGNALAADTAECPNCTTQVLSAKYAFPKISGYKIVSRIGEGGMGTIYLAEETSLGRRVAIKVITEKNSTGGQAHARFTREARALANVEHANVVRVYSFGEVAGQPYLAMEFIDGETLADRIRRIGRLSLEEAVRFTREIVVALEAAWEKGIIHRDIKPSNVLIDRRGKVHVADFGLAKPQVADDLHLTQSGHVVGTPYYVAPEQAQGKPTDFRADIYSTGILLYEMLAGERPFEGTTPFTVVAKHINEPLPSIRAKRADVPNRVARILERMTAKQPEQRPQSHADLIATLDALLGTTPKSIPRTETFSQLPKTSKADYRVPAIISALVIAAIIGWQSYRVRQTHPPGIEVPAERRLVVAVTPFYGPDDDSAKEGRVMAALVERSITSRLGADNVKVIGIDETKQPLRSHDAARQLGERVGAAVVVWGDAFALKRETEIQPYFTLVHRASRQASVAEKDNVRSVDLKSADPVAQLSERATPVMRVQAEAPNQIELRKTSAEGVGEMVTFLAAVHALYDENNPRKALQFFDQTPKTAESLRHRGQAYIQIGDRPDAIKTFEEALALDPKQTQSRAQMADLLLLEGKFAEAAGQYQSAAAAEVPYTTNYAIARGGLLYVRETFKNNDKELRDSGTLLEVSPQSGIVSRRWPMPGVIRTFEPRPDGFLIRYAADKNQTLFDTLTFGGNDFKRLPPPGGNLTLRMDGMRVAWLLPANFMGDLFGLIEKRPPHPRFRLIPKPLPTAPQALPELEEALRAATKRDPTQPWHLFWLGQTLLAEGKKEEAAAVWRTLISRDYPGVLYIDFNWMATDFERFGQRDWADLAFDKALRERKRMQEPIAFTTLIERLVNVQFTRMQKEQLKDPERAYLWLPRARMLSGLTEADNLTAAAWAGYFRRRGDMSRARIEQQNADNFARFPFNITSAYTRLDYLLYALVATGLGFMLSLALLLNKSDRSNIKNDLQLMLHSWRAPARRFPLILGTVIAALLIVASGIAVGATWSKPIGVAIAAIALIFFGYAVRIPARASVIYRQLSTKDRVALFVLFVLFVASALATNRARNRIEGLNSMPLGVADSLGHPVLIADLESRLAKAHTPELQYVTAVANQLGGKIEAARNLYRGLDDPRARRALAALDAGHSEISMPTVDEMYRTYTAGTSFFAGLPHGVIALFIIGLIFLIPFLFIKPAQTSKAPSPPKSRMGRVAAKASFLLVPGSFDLLRRSVLRGAITVTLFAFALFFGVSMVKAFPVMQSPGIFTAMSLPNLAGAYPFPPDTAPLDLMFAPIYARIFWPVAIAAIVALCVLHASRIPAIVSLYRDEPIHGRTTLVSAEEPA